MLDFIYLDKVQEDFNWLHHYYTQFFPEGRDKAWQRYQNSLRLIRMNPAIGKPHGVLPRRRHVVPKTPLVIYYQVNNNRLEIMRVWDTRRNIEHLTFDETKT